MDWINLHIPTQLRAPAFVGSSPAERGTWLSVLAYAAAIECGGRLAGAARWKDRQWQQAAGVTMREVRAAHRMLETDGDDVLVWGYNLGREAQVQGQRRGGLAGGSATSEAKARAARENGRAGGRPKLADGSTVAEIATDQETQEPNETQANPSRNRTEGEGEREGEGEGEDAKPTSRPRVDANDPHARWLLERLEPWARTLKAIPGIRGLDADGWQAWRTVVERFGAPAVVAAASTIEPRVRFADRVEGYLIEHAPPPDEDADPHEQAIRAAIKRHGWQRVVEASGIPVDRVRDGDQAADILTRYNRPGGERALAKLGGAAASGAA